MNKYSIFYIYILNLSERVNILISNLIYTAGFRQVPVRLQEGIMYYPKGGVVRPTF